MRSINKANKESKEPKSVFNNLKPSECQTVVCLHCAKLKHPFEMCMIEEIPNICMDCKNDSDKQLNEML